MLMRSVLEVGFEEVASAANSILLELSENLDSFLGAELGSRRAVRKLALLLAQ